MTASAERSASPRAALSIGEVLAQLRGDFPDITISKIRFLESEGLVEPQRTASGYRKFSHADVQRLRYVLTAQRDQYLPLRVIKEHLEALDRGLEPATSGAAPRVPLSAVRDEAHPTAADFTRAPDDLRLSRAELLEASGLADEALAQCEQYGLVATRGGSRYYDGDALAIARTVARLSDFGLESRHLKAFKSAADREVGLIEQIVTPMARQKGADSRARAEEVVRELAALSVSLHASLVRSGLGPALPR